MSRVVRPSSPVDPERMMSPVNPASYSARHAVASDPDIGGDFDAELQRLSAASREIMESLRGAPAFEEAAPVSNGDIDEAALLRDENDELRARVEQLEQLLQNSSPNEDVWAERQHEYEMLLEEKSEVIRTLHQKIRDLHQSAPAQPAAPTLPANVPEAHELVQLKDELDQQRRQLEEDEEAMMAQLREMEMALSRDRAELARQRQEVQRLQADLTREIEQASRDPGLRERLMSLRRSNEKPSTPSVSTPTPPPTDIGKKSSVFRRLFGQ
jgi:hypothetical protein